MTKSWVKLTIASLGSAACVFSCSSSDSGGLFDPATGSGSGGATGSGGASASSGSGGGATAGTGAGGALSGGGGSLASGGAGGTTQGGSAGSVGSGGKAATGGAGGKSSGGNSGSGGKATTGGGGGKATTGGASGSGGKAATGGSSPGGAGGNDAGGVGGSDDGCANCSANAECVASANRSSCVCSSGFFGDGVTCARPISCAELHELDPDAPSGPYTLKPAAAANEFESYCEMSAEGGGFTLVLNAGKAFDPSVQGNAKALGFAANGVNLAYSTVILASDVMLDVSNSAIDESSFSLRIVINGVHSATRGHTVRELFSGGPYYLETENNSNLEIRTQGAGNCNQVLESDFAHLVCDDCNGNNNNCSSPVIVFGDVDRCNDETPPFAIGGAESYSTGWGNCAGWPQSPSIGNNRYFPDNFRVWIR